MENYPYIRPEMFKNVQMTMLKHKNKTPFEFKYESRTDLKLVSGNIVQHCGKSSRTGWIGVVLGTNTQGLGRLDIRWLFTASGATCTERYNDYIGVAQSYSEDWANTNIKLCSNVLNVYYIETETYPFKHHATRKIPVDKLEEKKPEVIDNGERFILWSPKGIRNPKGVHTCQEVATKVAVAMTLKHDQEFFVCKLITTTKPIKKARIIKL